MVVIDARLTICLQVCGRAIVCGGGGGGGGGGRIIIVSYLELPLSGLSLMYSRYVGQWSCLVCRCCEEP